MRSVALKKILSLLPLLVLLGLAFGYLYFENHKPLVSPFAGIFDDGTGKVSQKVAKPLRLDFAKSIELESLKNIPRYIVYNADTGEVYHAKNSSEFMSPASFTKLLSTQVVLDLVAIDQVITATPESIDKVPTVLGLKTDEKLSVSELLRGAIATSANDAAQTLADGAASFNKLDRKDFTRLMNTKARLIGMSHSQFTNPDGLDDEAQFTTLEDLALLANNVSANYPEISSAAGTDRQDIEKTEDHDRYYLPNWNGLLGVYPGVDGLKIAYTENAGYSTMVTAKAEDKRFVVIVSGADSYLERDRAAADLLDAAHIAEKMSPKKINRWTLSKRYQEWADLANKIKAELEATKSESKNSTN